MKKIALVTCYFQHNYGSQLQALATQMICEKMGWPHETIRIDGLQKEINAAKYRYFLSRIWDRHTVADKMALVCKKVAAKAVPEYGVKLRKRDALFSAFAEEQFTLSMRYNSKAELGAVAHEYSAFVVGSDQLWLPSNITADYYTLNFVPDEVKKVAYSTSFGVKSLPKKQAKMAQQFLPRLNAVMVREETGKQLIKQLTGMEVPVVADPTLLFCAEEWDLKVSEGFRRVQKGSERLEVRGKRLEISDPYILCYFLGNNPGQRAFAKKMAKETGCKIVQLPHLDEYVKSDVGFADYPLFSVDPLDFVALIRGAKYVLTDSFHCSEFSTLYQKPFFAFRRYASDNAVSTNSRIYSLLESFGMPERLLQGNEEIATVLERLGKPDFTEAHRRIERLRAESIQLLKQAIE